MKITKLSSAKSFPLPIYKKIKIAKAVDKTGEEFSVYAGLDKKIAVQLKKLSLDKKDTELQENTGDRKRFGLGSYTAWYKQNRTPFVLVHNKTNALAAIVWFGPKPLGKKSIKFDKGKKLKKAKPEPYEGNWHTISYRAYPDFRGKGLTKKFGFFVIDAYMKKFPGIRLWAGIDTENEASRRISEAWGFKTLEKLSDRKAKWLVMVKY